MDRTRLTALLEEPGRVALQDLGALRELTERHPWFSSAHVLLASGEQALGEVMASEHLRDAAAHVPDREVLFNRTGRNAEREVPAPTLSVVRDDQPLDTAAEAVTVELPVIERKAAVITREPLTDNEIAERILEQQMLEAAIASGYSLGSLVTEAAAEMPTAPVASPAISKIDQLPPVPVEPVLSEPKSPPVIRERMRFTDWLDMATEVPGPIVPFRTLGSGDAEDWLRNPRTEAADQATSEEENQPIAARPTASSTTPSPTLTRDTIDRFLKKTEPGQPPRTEFFTPQEAGRRSLRVQADLVTETLARIYEQQGNFPKAAEAYRRLALKVPEKAAYFAALSQAAAEKQKKEG